MGALIRGRTFIAELMAETNEVAAGTDLVVNSDLSRQEMLAKSGCELVEQK